MNEENSIDKFKESIIQENDTPINVENEKKEILESISPMINQTESNFKYISKSPQINNEEYLEYKTKKIKLYNLYNQLLEFRQKLIAKEKELNKKEKNLLEFERILKSNESILKSNIEQFDKYIKDKINEIKSQFNQIEQIQLDKENYLREKEEEIINYTNQSYILQNYNNDKNKCLNCNCDLCNEDEIIKPFIDNYLAENYLNENNYNNNEMHCKKFNYNRKNGLYCSGCNKYFKDIHHQKNNSSNCIKLNSKFNHFKNNFIRNNNDRYIKNYFHKKNRMNTYDGTNDSSKYNYSCSCPGCEFCNS